jgi:hypothetical protein
VTRRNWLTAALALPRAGRAAVLESAWRTAGFDPETIRFLLEGPAMAGDAAIWPDETAPVPPGSLLKPFAALAYGAGHGFRYPMYKCTGEGCWFPSGHGTLAIEDAIAQSCNAYFHTLALNLTAASTGETAVRYGLPAPPEAASPDSLWGLGDGWRVPPRRLMRAYGELARRAEDPGVGPVVEGLRRSAASGTASGVRAQALAKTGTGPCMHRGSNGDGYACVLYPADKPRYTILLQLHGRTGREAARAAGVVLATLIRGMP